jgi:hypothetical protein
MRPQIRAGDRDDGTRFESERSAEERHLQSRRTVFVS